MSVPVHRATNREATFYPETTAATGSRRADTATEEFVTDMEKTQRIAVVLLVAGLAVFGLSWANGGTASRGDVLADTGSGISMALALLAALVIAVGGAFIAMWLHKNRKNK